VGVHHCVILSEEGRAVLEDLGTPNGTYVNGKRVAGQRELHTGDKLRIGPLEFEVQITVTVQGKKKPKIQSIQEAAARLADTGKPDELDVSLWIGDTSTSDESITDMLQQQQEDAEWLEETPTESQVQVTPAEVDSSKPATANSQDAAANVLRQLFGNK
jgi:predicted component of type VI protein secretion system